MPHTEIFNKPGSSHEKWVRPYYLSKGCHREALNKGKFVNTFRFVQNGCWQYTDSKLLHGYTTFNRHKVFDFPIHNRKFPFLPHHLLSLLAFLMFSPSFFLLLFNLYQSYPHSTNTISYHDQPCRSPITLRASARNLQRAPLTFQTKGFFREIPILSM